MNAKQEHPDSVVAYRAREARDFAGVTQSAVATALGVPRSAVSAIENGDRRVTAVELKKMADFYGRPVGWFLGEAHDDHGVEDALFRASKQLSDHDREQVLRFAEFLAGQGPPPGGGHERR